MLQPKTLFSASDSFGGEFWESRNANRFRLSLLVGAWTAQNFSAHYAGSLGHLSDHLSLNALSLSATNMKFQRTSTSLTESSLAFLNSQNSHQKG